MLKHETSLAQSGTRNADRKTHFITYEDCVKLELLSLFRDLGEARPELSEKVPSDNPDTLELLSLSPSSTVSIEMGGAALKMAALKTLRDYIIAITCT